MTETEKKFALDAIHFFKVMSFETFVDALSSKPLQVYTKALLEQTNFQLFFLNREHFIFQWVDNSMGFNGNSKEMLH
ncbi:hypothetical protein N7462_008245 [Penicillium macrosclerotiorum]|uniref:uncharacterized protein n=1 Tax=Penicillium macrosclerotiorum TaxID=303699 RepID=UPI0025482C73|nr:uncharacterized protein N7462_008245 [Penicillium macrosclerotiorum]KAJ5675348.1 hypothetical protein N7462_008245 [Penicillium macrosclerotiorum]